jgi:hypothetical protein
MGLLAYHKYKKLVSGNYRSGLSLSKRVKITSGFSSAIANDG